MTWKVCQKMRMSWSSLHIAGTCSVCYTEGQDKWESWDGEVGGKTSLKHSRCQGVKPCGRPTLLDTVLGHSSASKGNRERAVHLKIFPWILLLAVNCLSFHLSWHQLWWRAYIISTKNRKKTPLLIKLYHNHAFLLRLFILCFLWEFSYTFD